MSSLWTPSGEHVPATGDGHVHLPPPGVDDAAAQERAQAAVDAMRDELAGTPAEVVVANHCYGLFELAAIYLSQTPPMLYQARLAIDGLGAVLERLEGRLGEAEPSLLESLSQLRLAYVRLEGAEQASAVDAAAQGGTGPSAAPSSSTGPA